MPQFVAFHLPIARMSSGASDRAQDRGICPEDERAGKRSLGSEEQDGLAGKGKAAENDEAHRARVGGGGRPARPESGPPWQLREAGPVLVIAVRRAQSPLPLRRQKVTKVPFPDP